MLQAGSFLEVRVMPVTPPAPVPPPTVPTPHVVPVNQRVVPVEPAKRVTRNKDAERTDKDGVEKRRHDPEDGRGNLYDLEA
jgi:hypothetical protein